MKEESRMRAKAKISSALILSVALSVASSVIAQEKKNNEAKKAEEPAKAKAEKVSGDIGLLDTEKHYLIVVTKDGKLITLDYNDKTKAQEIKDTKVKMADVGLGSSANVEYVTKGDKNFLTKMEFRPAKGE
jgi:hypothetical protein